jgi:subtilisin family serine protease
LVISAAGNNGKDIDLVENNYFPSSYRLNNMITVASVNSVGDLSETSNYGINSVDVAAFGVKIKSFGLNEQMVSLSGTSQATAQVSSLVSKIVSINPGLTNDQIKSLITKTVDKKIELRDKIKSGGVINKNRAISRSMDLVYSN